GIGRGNPWWTAAQPLSRFIGMVAVRRIVLLGTLLTALPAFAQSGLRLPERGEPGLDPMFARSWLAPEYDRFGFAAYHWRPRSEWSYQATDRGNLGLSLSTRRYSDLDPRPMSVFV